MIKLLGGGVGLSKRERVRNTLQKSPGRKEGTGHLKKKKSERKLIEFDGELRIVPDVCGEEVQVGLSNSVPGLNEKRQSEIRLEKKLTIKKGS